ncbi:Vomp family autotransporter [Bartonella sp. ML71XJBT]|uniref:Vomp family autotransporter n=1 Tax=Bartonella sp. ML71XJBT TaxID=3019094 RepID=UPI002360511B|nr:Vomp family autotransporter [Bartonella sp. ML71XJBT]
MKKKYSKSNLLKAVSLGTAMAALLSSVSPVFAANLALVGGAVQSTSLQGVVYPHGSHGSVVFAGDDDYCGADSVVGRGGKQQQGIKDSQRITAQEQYDRFIGEKVFGGRSPYGTTTEKETWVGDGVTSISGAYMGTPTFGVMNAMPEAYGIYSFATGCGSAATGNYSTVFGAGATAKAGGAQAFGVSALASGIASVAMGVDSEASGKSAVAIGGLATALGQNSVALGSKVKAADNYAIAIGSEAEAQASGSIAIGGRRSNRTEGVDPNRKVTAKAENAIAIGTQAYAETQDSVAIGVNSQVLSKDGVAVGGGSISDREKDKGYDPATGKETTKTGIAWQSTTGAFSVGEVGGRDGKGQLTRQITGVAAGKEDTDAVNVAQLKAIQFAAAGAWKLGVNDEEPTDVNSGNTVDFSVKNSAVGKDNLKIEKLTENNKNKIEFTLADHLKLTQVTTGQASMSDDGFIIQNGPMMTIDGIDAGNKVITGVADATEDNEAVNYKQLKAIQEATKTSWQLAVEGGDATAIGPNGMVNLQAAGNENKKNIKIEKDNDHNVTFSLANNITVKSVTTGNSKMSDEGFGFINGNGPKITLNGIDAGSKKITKVVEGTDDTDAVNFKQLKDLTAGIKTGWKLAVEDEETTDVGAGSTVKFTAVEDDDFNKNIKIVRGANNEVKFDLADNINVTTVTAGESIMNEDGFIIQNGPSMTVDGINAGYTNITKVLEATEDDEAVNFGQLKRFVGKRSGWKLSVDGQNATDVTAGSTVDFVAATDDDGSKNIKIVRGNDNGDVNKVTFDLADDINVMTVTAGESIMNAVGFAFKGGDGPSITVQGIHAGNKTIKGVEKGTENTDAVNVSQLNEVKNQIAGNSLVKWDEGQELITIGKEKGGTKINIANKSGADRTIAGVKAAEKGNEAVNKNQLDDSIKEVNAFVINNVNAFAVLYDKKNDGTVNYESVTLGGGKINGQVALHNVKNGDITKASTDAINGSQINKISQDVAQFFGGNAAFQDGAFVGPRYELKTIEEDDTIDIKQYSDVGSALDAVNGNVFQVDHNMIVGFNDIAAYFGGGAKYEKGKWHTPTFKVSQRDTNGGIVKNNYQNVADAFDAVDTSITDIYSQINNVTGNSLVKWIEDQKLITIGAQKGGMEINIAGTEGERTIAGVKDGDISADSSDAINGSQINTISGKIAKFFGGGTSFENGQFTGPEYELKTIEEDGTIAIKTYGDVGSALDAVNGNVFQVDHNMIVGFTDIADYFGGGAKYEKGKWQAPTFKVSQRDTNGGIVKNNYQNVADAFDAVDTSITDIYSQINNVTSNSLVKWVEDQKLITIGAQKDGTKISIANSNGQNRVISGVADGNLGKVSTDAINGSQINKISGDIAQFFGGDAAFQDGAFVGPRYNLSTVSADGNVEQNTFDNVGDALTGLDANVKNVNKHIQYVDNKFNKFSQDALLWDDGKGAFSARHEKNGRKTDSKITSLLKGDVTEDSTDAINGSQLFNIAQNISEYFGGSTDVIEGIQPTFLIDGNSYNNVTEAFTGVNVSIHKIDNKISNLEKNNLVKQEGGVTSIITIGKDTAGTEINIAGVGKIARKISGVQEAEKGDEAVNKNQLDKSIEKISKDIETASAAAVLYDKDEGGIVNYGSVTLGGDKNNGPVALLNVKDGRISQDSHDAINGSQINKISRDIANYFGGDAKFVGGTFKGPKYSLSVIVEEGQVAKANYYNVGDALTGLDANVKSVNNRITNVANNFNQKIEGISKDALLWGEEEQAFVARHEKDGKKTNSKLKYLVDGDISADSTDAINGSQLYSISNQLAAYFGGGAKYENGQWTAPQFKIVQVNADGTTVEKTHNNVADALGDVNQNMSNINNRIDDVINKGDSDALKWNKEKGAYDATHDGTPSKIINVADGKIAKGSKDAVNGGQLWQTNERVAKVENRVTDVENHVTIIDKKVDNISNTIEDIGDTITNINVRVDNIDDKVNNIAEDAVRYDRDENGKKTNKITLKGGDPSEPVMIDNVADGRIEKGSKEAINGGQLHDYTKEQMKIVLDESKKYTDQRVNNIVIDAIDDAVDKSKHYTDMKFNALNYSIEGARKEARQAAAIGLAVANLRYNETPGKLSIGFGSGLWRSQSAFAFGAGYTSEKGDIRSNVSVTTSGGHWGVGAGFNMTLN